VRCHWDDVDRAVPFRILSFDGGGIRGLLSTLLLRRLIDESSLSDLVDRVDMFAGTSTGGLIALGLAAEIPLDKIGELYLRAGPKIFTENFFGQFRDVGNLFRPQYSNRELRQVLGEIFGDKKLGDLNRRVMVPAFELDNLKGNRADGAQRSFTIYQIARRIRIAWCAMWRSILVLLRPIFRLQTVSLTVVCSRTIPVFALSLRPSTGDGAVIRV
jgi:Patatin-like phospholipase